MSKEIVAFIGLGVMGYPMAGHLANAGYSTRVYNRTMAKAEQWCKDYQGSWAATPREAAEDADFVFICVGNDDDLRSVVYGEDGVLAGITDGAILVDHTTASANVAREISNQSQVPFLDAPVSGGQAGAENGVLTVMVGGEQTAFDTAKPVILSY
ncbi:MAG: NAD(P)-dependent oxidoreductase, partial [Gammaproteobacteria bacterium]|nr:NAD(P)-dependent oxidoreductase [Gammaproteobacteria bacterium]